MPDYAFSIIIPVFNSWEYTHACLHSLREHAGRDDFEVIVVDNASTDATRTELEPLGKNLFGTAFTRVRNNANANFGPACNQGAQRAAADLLFFLNNDTVVTSGWHQPLLRALADDASSGAVGPLLLYGDHTVQHLGVACSTKGFSHLYSRFPANHPAVKRPRDLQFLTGAALLLPKSVFEDAGGFYQGYCNGMEDLELCLRIRQKGKRLRCIPESVIFHHESKSPGRHAHDEHNDRLFIERCGAALYPDLHVHGADDGFEVVLNDWLDLSLLVAPGDDARLRAEAAGKPYDHLYDLVTQNPYWLWGNETLAGILEESDLPVDAAYFYGHIMLCRPSLTHAKALLRVLLKAGNSQVAEGVAEELRAMTAFAADKEQQVRTIKTEIARATERNDITLLKLFTRKLAAMQP